MLSHMLRAASARRVPLVASKVVNFSGSGYASQSISLSDLPIQTGDLIVFTSSSYVLTNPTTISVNSFLGYSSAYSVQIDRLRAATFYKTATSLESSIVFEWTGGTASDVSCVVAVFRGYQYNSSATATSTSRNIDPPSIACSINDLIIAAYQSQNGGNIISYPSGYVNVRRTIGGDETATTMAYKIATSTTENPPIVEDEDSEFSVGGTIRCTPI